MDTKDMKLMQKSNPNPTALRTAAIKELRKAFDAEAEKVIPAVDSLSENQRRTVHKPFANVEAPASLLALVLRDNPEMAALVPQIDSKEMLDKVELIAAAIDARAELAK